MSRKKIEHSHEIGHQTATIFWFEFLKNKNSDHSTRKTFQTDKGNKQFFSLN